MEIPPLASPVINLWGNLSFATPERSQTEVCATSSHFFVLRIDIFIGEGDAIILRLYLFRDQQIIFSLQEIGPVVNRQLKIVAVSDGVFRTSLDAVAAKDAASIVDVVNLRIALIDADPLFGGTRIVGSFDVNAFRRTSSRAEKTSDTLLAAQL